MNFYNETPHGFELIGDPSSPTELDNVETNDDDFDPLGGESDSMLGCVGEDK